MGSPINGLWQLITVLGNQKGGRAWLRPGCFDPVKEWAGSGGACGKQADSESTTHFSHPTPAIDPRP